VAPPLTVNAGRASPDSVAAARLILSASSPMSSIEADGSMTTNSSPPVRASSAPVAPRGA
jgi:hypothetical protein